MTPVVYTVGEVAGIMRCSINSVYRLAEDGRLRSFTVGKTGLRITATALEAYMSGPPAAEPAPTNVTRIGRAS